MKQLFPVLMRRMRKELGKFGYSLTIKPSASIDDDFTVVVKKGKDHIFTTRDRKELLHGHNLICKLEGLF